MRNLLKASLIMIIFYGCNSSPKKMEEAIKQDVASSKLDMVKDYNQQKATFDLLFQNTIKMIDDSNSIKNLEKLYTKELNILSYIDSIKAELDKLDNSDLKNVNYIKDMFIGNGVSDSIFSKANEVYSIAEKVAASSKMKSEIKVSRNNMLGDVEYKKQHFFGLTGPLGAWMILYGFQGELLKIGINSLKDITVSEAPAKR